MKSSVLRLWTIYHLSVVHIDPLHQLYHHHHYHLHSHYNHPHHPHHYYQNHTIHLLLIIMTYKNYHQYDHHHYHRKNYNHHYIVYLFNNSYTAQRRLCSSPFGVGPEEEEMMIEEDWMIVIIIIIISIIIIIIITIIIIIIMIIKTNITDHSFHYTSSLSLYIIIINIPEQAPSMHPQTIVSWSAQGRSHPPPCRSPAPL